MSKDNSELISEIEHYILGDIYDDLSEIKPHSKLDNGGLDELLKFLKDINVKLISIFSGKFKFVMTDDCFSVVFLSDSKCITIASYPYFIYSEYNHTYNDVINNIKSKDIDNSSILPDVLSTINSFVRINELYNQNPELCRELSKELMSFNIEMLSVLKGGL